MTAGTATRHLGLDLGATNLKWAVVEHADGAWTHRSPTARCRRGCVADPEAVPASVVGPAGRGRGGGDRRRGGPVVSVGIGVPGLYDPAAGTTRFLPNVPGPWAGQPVAGPVAAAVGRAGVPHQRRPRVRPRRAAAGGRARRLLDGRPDPRDGRRRRASRSTGASTRGTTARPASSATRRSTPTGRGAAAATAAASRPTPGPTRSRPRAGPRPPRRRCARARAGDERALGGPRGGRPLPGDRDQQHRRRHLARPDRDRAAAWRPPASSSSSPIRAEIARRVTITSHRRRDRSSRRSSGTLAGAIGAAVHGAEQAAAASVPLMAARTPTWLRSLPPRSSRRCASASPTLQPGDPLPSDATCAASSG